jgi:hypothetical protein
MKLSLSVLKTLRAKYDLDAAVFGILIYKRIKIGKTRYATLLG